MGTYSELMCGIWWGMERGMEGRQSYIKFGKADLGEKPLRLKMLSGH
jgi:hypothetical protein